VTRASIQLAGSPTWSPGRILTITGGSGRAASAKTFTDIAAAKATERETRSVLWDGRAYQRRLMGTTYHIPRCCYLRLDVVGEKQLLASDFVVSDCVLTLPRGKPFDEGHTFTVGCRAELTSMTAYWLKRRASWSTTISRLRRSRN